MPPRLYRYLISPLLLVLLSSLALAAPETFTQSKKELRQYVYQDQNDKGDFYCGCDWEWTGASGGRVDVNTGSAGARWRRARRNGWWPSPAAPCWKPSAC